MSAQMINIKFSIREAFELIPKLSKRIIEESPKAAELSKEMDGTEFSYVAEIEGVQYSLIIKNGDEFEIPGTTIEKPTLKISSTIEDLEKLFSIKSVDAIIKDNNSISKAKFDTLSTASGTVDFTVINDDQSSSEIQITFNGAKSPSTKIKMTASNLRAIVSKEATPVNLFMAGEIKMEGDVGLAMALQPLLI